MKAFYAWAALIGLVLGFLWSQDYHIRKQPTADELYGCTPAQQAPNGDCK